jgi:hypothetical protein
MDPSTEFLQMMRNGIEAQEIERYLAQGANPNIQEPASLKTPLHYAVEAVDIDAVRVLLKAQANPFLQDRQNRNPRLLAEYLPKGDDAQDYRFDKKKLAEIEEVLKSAERQPKPQPNGKLPSHPSR